MYDLERMREVGLVDKIIREDVYKELTNKYMFLGSVGDQVSRSRWSEEKNVFFFIPYAHDAIDVMVQRLSKKSMIEVCFPLSTVILF